MKAAVYVRVSTDNFEQETSLQNQEDMFHTYIEENGWTLYKVYKDVESGTHGKRPCFIEMMEDAKEGKFDIVLAKELSRLVRNIGLSHEFKQVAFANNIHIICLDGSINTLKDDISRFGLFSWLYEDESRRMSNRIKAAKRAKAERKEFLTGDPPYGYYLDKGKLIPRGDDTPDNVREIFSLYMKGFGVDTIARMLMDKGIISPSQLKGRKNATSRWYGSTIKGMLSNVHYTGDLLLCNTTTIDITSPKRIDAKKPVFNENTHEAIIDKTTFQLVHKTMKERRSVEDAYRRKSINNYAGKLYCKECGKKLWYIAERRTYLCGTYKKLGTKYCSDHKTKEDDLDDIILKDLKEFSKKFSNSKKFEKKIEERIKSNDESSSNMRLSLDEKRSNLASIKGKLVIKYTLEKISKDVYESAVSEIDRELIELKEHILKLDEILNNQDALKTKLDVKVI